MSISTLELALPRAVAVTFGEAALTVELSDGRVISAPLTWFPRLLNGSPAERSEWRLVGDGDGVHWPRLDEDISVESLVAGRPSAESAQSLTRWLAARS
jgi:Protein of unknown function (DUF2442)